MSSPNDKPGPFAPQAHAPPGMPQQGDGPPAAFAPQVMGGPPAASFAPQVMGAPAPASFAPQVMGGAAPAPFAPQTMGGAAPAPFAPQTMGGVAPAPFAPQTMGGAPMGAPPPGSKPAGGFDPPATAELAPAVPQMGAPMGPVGVPGGAGIGAAAPAEDNGLAASPWNTGNMAGFNRDLLPSAMVAPAPEPGPASRRAAAAPLAEEPSRAPWIIVGVLVVVAIASGVAVFQIRGRQGKDGQIEVPAGAGTATDDTPADSAPVASASGSPTGAPRVAAPVHAVVKPKAYVDDPYGDAPPAPKPHPAQTATPAGVPGSAPHRLFGSEN